MFNVAGIGKSLWTNLIGKVMGTYADRVHPSLIYDKENNEETDWHFSESVKEKDFYHLKVQMYRKLM